MSSVIGKIGKVRSTRIESADISSPMKVSMPMKVRLALPGRKGSPVGKASRNPSGAISIERARTVLGNPSSSIRDRWPGMPRASARSARARHEVACSHFAALLIVPGGAGSEGG